MKYFIPRLTLFFVFLPLSLALVSCGKEGTNLSVQPITERFTGRNITPEIDILWVVDSSGSMAPKQQNLANNFESFITSFLDKSFDFHMSIVRSDLSSRTGSDGSFEGTPTVLKSNTQNLTSTFQKNIKVGDEGASNQKVLDTIEKALSAEKLANENSGFWRENAHLAIIVVSDADDNDSDTNVNNIINFLNTNKPKITDPNTGLEYDGFSTHAIISFKSNCNTCNIVSEKGVKFISLVEATGGFAGDICDNDFSSGLSQISDRIIQFVTYVALSRKPNLSTILVRVNNNLVPNDSSNGWTYDSSKNRILFHGTSLPAADDSIEVSYFPDF